jgi:hypothetical protein
VLFILLLCYLSLGRSWTKLGRSDSDEKQRKKVGASATRFSTRSLPVFSFSNVAVRFTGASSVDSHRSTKRTHLDFQRLGLVVLRRLPLQPQKPSQTLKDTA